MLLEGLTLSDTVRDLASWRLLKNGPKGAVVRASPSQDVTQYLLIYFLGRSLGSHPTASTADRQDLSSLEIKNLLAGTSLLHNNCLAGTSLLHKYCLAGTSLLHKYCLAGTCLLDNYCVAGTYLGFILKIYRLIKYQVMNRYIWKTFAKLSHSSSSSQVEAEIALYPADPATHWPFHPE